MSDEKASFVVKVEQILDIQPHPNAERLELATVLGWNCVIQKGAFKKGDLCVYIPIDSILPSNIEQMIFGRESKIQLGKGRVKTIKLRGAISQGLVVPLSTLGLGELPKGRDVTKALGVTKYEPPVKSLPSGMGVKMVSKKHLENPNFHKYGGIENFKNYPNIFKDGELVYITEKIHGTNFRAGYVPTVANTLWRKVLKFIGKLPAYEFVFGSNNVQLQQKGDGKGYYEGLNVYEEAVKKYHLRDKLLPGEVIYGEIYGDGIQKGYTYGCGPGERKLVVFDLKVDGKYVAPANFIEFCRIRGLPCPPRVTPFFLEKYSKDLVLALSQGPSILAPGQRVREGVVVKPVLEEVCMIGRKLLKVISDEYLLGDQTDFH